MNAEFQQDMAALAALTIITMIAWPAGFAISPIILGAVADNIQTGAYFHVDERDDQPEQ